jgi:tubulin delta
VSGRHAEEMALILVNAGQCGNQLGFDCLDSLYDNTARDSADQAMFFRESKAAGGKPVARAVCLDTEPKAVLSCLQRSARKDWAFDPAACAYRHGGAGNNWAMGYQMCSGKFLDASLDCIRRELEHCDLPPTLLTSHSLGGGTGSGLGTKITEAVAEVFPDVTRINATVMPYHFGEVIVQHYNSVLCLSKIAQCSDGIMLFDNEIAHDMCKTGFGKDRPVLKDLNLAISMGLVSALLPKTSTCTGAADGSVQSSGLPMQIAHLCSHPGFKFLDVKFVPQVCFI